MSQVYSHYLFYWIHGVQSSVFRCSWSTWTQVLCLIDNNLFSFFYMQTTCLMSFICWKCQVCILVSLLKIKVFISLWTCIYISIPSINMFFLFYDNAIYCFYYYNSVIQFEIRDNDTAGSSFIIKICFSWPVIFLFPYETEDCSFFFLISVTNLVGVFIMIALNLQVAFGRKPTSLY